MHLLTTMETIFRGVMLRPFFPVRNDIGWRMDIIANCGIPERIISPTIGTWVSQFELGFLT